MRTLLVAALLIPASTVLAQPAGNDPPPATTVNTINPKTPDAADLNYQPAAISFGKAGTQWWTVGGGFSDDFSKAFGANAMVSFSSFFVDNVEGAVELSAWYYDQPGDDAIAFNPSAVIRWHFINTGGWTVYVDGGIGVMVSSDNVPEDGTGFNFTPRLGVGFTRALNDSGSHRLMVGLRWSHVSNARIEGNDDNPGRDSAMLYAGFIFPF